MVATNAGVMDRQGVIQYVGENASRFGLDPAAVLAVANHEGLNRDPGSGNPLTWVIPGESGFNFGPPSWYTGGAGATIVGMQGSNAPLWSWTPEGLDYWLQQVSHVANGLRGTAAISAIVHGFERPREDLAAGEIQNASNDYNMFQQAIQSIGNTPGVIPIPGVTDSQGDFGHNTIPRSLGGETQTQTGVQGQLTPSGAQTTSMDLNLGDSIRHLSFQFLLLLFALALLLGGIYLLGSRA